MCVAKMKREAKGKKNKNSGSRMRKFSSSSSFSSLSACVLLPTGWSLKCASYMRLGNSISGSRGEMPDQIKGKKFITRHKSSTAPPPTITTTTLLASSYHSNTLLLLLLPPPCSYRPSSRCIQRFTDKEREPVYQVEINSSFRRQTESATPYSLS